MTEAGASRERFAKGTLYPPFCRPLFSLFSLSLSSAHNYRLFRFYERAKFYERLEGIIVIFLGRLESAPPLMIARRDAK